MWSIYHTLQNCITGICKITWLVSLTCICYYTIAIYHNIFTLILIFNCELDQTSLTFQSKYKLFFDKNAFPNSHLQNGGQLSQLSRTGATGGKSLIFIETSRFSELFHGNGYGKVTAMVVWLYWGLYPQLLLQFDNISLVYLKTHQRFWSHALDKWAVDSFFKGTELRKWWPCHAFSMPNTFHNTCKYYSKMEIVLLLCRVKLYKPRPHHWFANNRCQEFHS